MTIHFTRQAIDADHRIAYKVVRKSIWDSTPTFLSEYDPDGRCFQKMEDGSAHCDSKGEVITYIPGEYMKAKENSFGYYLFGTLEGAKEEIRLFGDPSYFTVIKVFVPRGTLIWEGIHSGFTKETVFTAYEIVVLKEEK